MKKCTVWLMILCLLFSSVLFGGCSAVLGKQLREKVESYVSRLEKAPGVSDRFTVGETPGFGSKTSLIGFPVKSETYGKEFLVYVSRDGSEISDQYYTLYLQKEAEEAVLSVFEACGTDPAFTPSVSLGRIANPALSNHAAGSLKELYTLSGNALMLEIHVKSGGTDNLDEAQTDRLMLELKKEGLYSNFFPYISSAVWFEVTPEGFWKNTQSGADNGAYLNRDAYTPAAP